MNHVWDKKYVALEGKSVCFESLSPRSVEGPDLQNECADSFSDVSDRKISFLYLASLVDLIVDLFAHHASTHNRVDLLC